MVSEILNKVVSTCGKDIKASFRILLDMCSTAEDL